MNLLFAFDSFKGTLSSLQIAEALAAHFPKDTIRILPLADGGEGSLQSIESVLVGSTSRQIKTFDPLMRPICVPYLHHEGVIYLESAHIIGLPLLTADELIPLESSSFGVGHAIKSLPQSDEIVIALGGSATIDGGLGMAMALGFQFLDVNGIALPPAAKSLFTFETIVAPQNQNQNLPQITCLVDVESPLLGENGAVYCYGPQKGASAAMLPLLEEGMQRLFTIAQLKDLPMRGAAGGLGAGLEVFTQATLHSGAQTLLELHEINEHIAWADCVISGEGKIDHQTQYGKLLWRIAQRCRAQNTPLISITGHKGPGWECMQPLSKEILAFTDYCTFEQALSSPRVALDKVAQHLQL